MEKIKAEDIKTYVDLVLYIRGMRNNIMTHYVSCVVIKDLDRIKDLVDRHPTFVAYDFTSEAFGIIKDFGVICGVQYRIDKDIDPWIDLEFGEWKDIIPYAEEAVNKMNSSPAGKIIEVKNILDGCTDKDLLKQSILWGNCFRDLKMIRDRANISTAIVNEIREIVDDGMVPGVVMSEATLRIMLDQKGLSKDKIKEAVDHVKETGKIFGEYEILLVDEIPTGDFFVNATPNKPELLTSDNHKENKPLRKFKGAALGISTKDIEKFKKMKCFKSNQ